MNSETLERIKKDMQGNRFSDKELTVISLNEGLDLVAEVERLQAENEELKIKEETYTDTNRVLKAEINRLQKEVNALENKPLNTYLDRELEIERLEAEVERLRLADSRSYADKIEEVNDEPFSD